MSSKCLQPKSSPTSSTLLPLPMSESFISGNSSTTSPSNTFSRPKGSSPKVSQASRTRTCSCFGLATQAIMKPSRTTWPFVCWRHNQKKLTKCFNRSKSAVRTTRISSGGTEWDRLCFRTTMKLIRKRLIH